MASALPPTATSTMNTKRLVAATAERVSPCLGPDAVAGAEDALGIASGDAATAPSAGLCVDFGVGPAGVLVGVLFGATTAMATVLQSLIVESAEDDAHTWCWPAPAAFAGGRAARVAAHAGGLPPEDAGTSAHVPPSQVNVTLPQLSSGCRYVKVAEMDGAG